MATHAPALWKEASTGEIVRVRKQTFPSVPIPPHKPSGTLWQRCCSSCLAPGWFLLSVGFCIAPWQLSGSPSLIKVIEMSPAEFHKITEAENGSGWKEAQWVLWSHLPSKQGHPRARAQFCSQRVLEYFSVVGHTLQLWLWMKSTGRHTNFKMGLSMQTALHVLIFWVHNLGTLVLPPFDCS